MNKLLSFGKGDKILYAEDGFLQISSTTEPQPIGFVDKELELPETQEACLTFSNLESVEAVINALSIVRRKMLRSKSNV